MSGEFMSVLQDLIAEAIPSQKCYMNIAPTLSGYEATDILNSKLFEPYEDQKHYSALNN